MARSLCEESGATEREHWEPVGEMEKKPLPVLCAIDMTLEPVTKGCMILSFSLFLFLTRAEVPWRRRWKAVLEAGKMIDPKVSQIKDSEVTCQLHRCLSVKTYTPSFWCDDALA
ncbi:uncharacterized protein VDAG_08763 [Verticillium dahliae VdLs.17]|uniref:Uncharacterized protein n=1 Tax=Verticillium dahliae (strain VdLs.17 / ATCC MYA-4575 / FGSC 10137) TaxID=498257 RepID=G2XF31_VERDV|nr:uncharacterized protein VDAG_08763 [Verticillium dahliae VdLs.17]EGY18429.1 hypothetical protein VDAG_08763 [Verticillium dahliae VdLs.17]